MRGVPGNPRNVRAADADIGEFTIAQARQLVHALVVTLPLLDEADDCGKHGISLPFRPTDAGHVLKCKIGALSGLKSNNAAAQLSGKCIAKTTEN